MTGFQEILIVAGIVLGILFIPRMVPKKTAPRQVRPKQVITGKMRLAITVSVLYPLLCAVYFQPWQKDLVLFISVGIVPVAVGWLAAWVVAGFTRGRTRGR